MINFRDYMKSLHEDFEHTNNSKEFGEVTPPSTKDNTLAEEPESVNEQDEFGEDKLDQPDSEGLDAAAAAANSFTNASDGEDTDVNMIFNKTLTDEDFDNVEEDTDMSKYFTEASEPESTNIPDLPEDVRKNLREAAEYILAVLDEEYAPNGEDPDDHIDADGVDQNTVPAYPEENEQFSNVDGLSDKFADNDIEESFSNWDDLF